MTIRNHKLRAGIAFGAAVATPLATVQAQTQNSEDYTVIRTEGGMSESKFTQAKIGDLEDNEYSQGLYGSVEILRSVNNGWDWSVSATSQDLGSVNNFDNSEGGNVNTGFSSKSIDFDIGKNFQRNYVDLRLSAGLTALQLEEQKGLSAFFGPPDGYPFTSDVSSKYLGFGGRLGIDGKLQLGENSPLSIFAGASTSITHGQHDMRKGLSFYEESEQDSIDRFELSQAMTTSDKVNHTSANIGLEVEAGNNTTFRIGVRHDKYSFEDTDSLFGDIISGDSISGNTGYVGVAIRF
jgi:hypothetical protein